MSNIIEENTNLLNEIGVTNKTHFKLLSKYHELKMIRIAVFLISFFSIMTTPNPYVSTAAMIYIILELFLYKYDSNLRKTYNVMRVDGLLKMQEVK